MITDNEKQKFLDEVERTYIISHAVKKTSISRATIYRWMKEDADFKQELLEKRRRGRNVMNDAAESVIISGIQNKDTNAAKYFLQHNHPAYMNRERAERENEKKKLEDDRAWRVIDMLKGLKIWRDHKNNRDLPDHLQEAPERPALPDDVQPSDRDLFPDETDPNQ